MTENGVEFNCRSDDYITGEYAKKFILVLSNEFNDDLIVVLDGAPYFQASKGTDLAERDNLEFVRLLPYSPDLNSLEECWRQLKESPRNRFFESKEELEAVIQEGLTTISTPNTSNYL